MSPNRVASLPALALAWLSVSACAPEPADPGPGVPASLARQRAEAIDDLSYEIRLEIPRSPRQPVRGRLVARFAADRLPARLAFDFAAGADAVERVTARGSPAPFEVKDEHILLATAGLASGRQEIEIVFRAGDSSLNRSEDFLYTLFVPDRARFAIPVFDQPDLKARWRLTLEVPSDWEAIANGPIEESDVEGDRQILRFAETEPIPSYLFAFAAGVFDVVHGERAGRTFRFLHRETDLAKVERNLESIFDLHGGALAWLEDYTGIAHPFAKLDFVALPAFQYGGMEHPGAIFYRDRGLFLDETATQSERLGRASLIAHEVAHMWFGNLVTMRWFDDVWMKEVFANFMAAKIVNPAFPEVDHGLRFLLTHYPAAYAVDRTSGANPIRQRLDNLAEAGSLYGAIIYQKAPIVMRHLELMVGEEALRDGLRRYLSEHAYGNAGWNDLIDVLDGLTREDLAAWSRIWVEEAGRPTLEVEVGSEITPEGASRYPLESLHIVQTDPAGRGRVWPQPLAVRFGRSDGTAAIRTLRLRRARQSLDALETLEPPAYLLLNGDGVGYGNFVLDEASREVLLRALPALPDAGVRAVAWLSLWDGMLDGLVPPQRFLDLALDALETEAVELNIERMLADLGTTFWLFLDAERRATAAPRIEDLLWRRLSAADRSTLKSSFLAAYRDLTTSEVAIGRLLDIWSGEVSLDGLPLSENDTTRLAQQLALRLPERADELLDRQRERITNPDSVARFDFVRPALSADLAIRDAFFASLADPANRQREPWVLEAVRLLHHPLRSEASVSYIGASLSLLEEIQATGDIFFPLAWLNATLSGHSSASAARTVRDFLDERDDLPPRLRGKLLQAADLLIRAARSTSDPRDGREGAPHGGAAGVSSHPAPKGDAP